MWNILKNYQSKVSQFSFSTEIQKDDLVIYEKEQLKVTLDSNPLGSHNRQSPVGTVTIHHVNKKSFDQWSEDDLFQLAELERKFLFINERLGVSNNLILGRQEGAQREFKVTIVPYQACTLIEKIKVFMRVLFKSWIKPITKKQAIDRFNFYRNRLNQEYTFKVRPNPQQSKPDAFCRPDVIEVQKIFDFTTSDGTFHILHDKRPKGEPHFLIVPKEAAHYDGSNHDDIRRFRVLEFTQQAARVALEEKSNSTLFVVECNGAKLQSVQHKHKHVISAKYPLNSFLGKIRTIASIFWASFWAVSPSLYEHYKEYNWSNLKVEEEEGILEI